MRLGGGFCGYLAMTETLAYKVRVVFTTIFAGGFPCSQITS